MPLTLQASCLTITPLQHIGFQILFLVAYLPAAWWVSTRVRSTIAQPSLAFRHNIAPFIHTPLSKSDDLSLALRRLRIFHPFCWNTTNFRTSAYVPSTHLFVMEIASPSDNSHPSTQRACPHMKRYLHSNRRGLLIIAEIAIQSEALSSCPTRYLPLLNADHSKQILLFTSH